MFLPTEDTDETVVWANPIGAWLHTIKCGLGDAQGGVMGMGGHLEHKIESAASRGQRSLSTSKIDYML